MLELAGEMKAIFVILALGQNRKIHSDHVLKYIQDIVMNVPLRDFCINKINVFLTILEAEESKVKVFAVCSE